MSYRDLELEDMAGPQIRRLYFSASDVCRIVGINPVLLKAWEQKYSALKPARSQTGRRLYRPADLALVRRIKRLKDVGYTDEKTREMLHPDLMDESELSPEEIRPRPVARPAKNPDIIRAVQGDLKEILEMLDEPEGG
ncbi:MAG TPA: MerR family transcriptional regulator, partial [bacterium]|nr:MerR family transcriptional regulator [bacterium]